MQQNIGRDISKFFYGGYSLENNLGSKPGEGYRHSNYARYIVNSIAIATYEAESPVTKVKLEQKLSYPINKSTAILFFRAQQNHFKSYYPGT